MNTPVIESKSLSMQNSKFQKITYVDDNLSFLIRPLEENDAEKIHSAVLHSREHLYPFMDWSHRETCIEQQKERIRASMESFSKGVSYDFVVLDPVSNEFLMSASLHVARSLNKKSLAIGYWTSAQYCNKGLATTVTKILIAMCFEIFDCDRVEVCCNKANEKSRRVIEKVGFKFECEARNYFSKPTLEMIQNGYTSERTGLLYTLTSDDINELQWYQFIVSHLKLTTMGSVL